LGFFSTELHESTTVRSESIYNRSRVSGDGVNALVSATNHHLVDNDLLCAKNDSVFANNTADGAGVLDSFLSVFNLEQSAIW
jgi:hypothetical protein